MSGGEGRVQGRGAASGNTGAHLLCGAAPRALELEDGCAARTTRRKNEILLVDRGTEIPTPCI